LRDATIADNGKLTQAHQGLNNLLPGSLSATKSVSRSIEKKNVLLLGSGMVAAPLVEHLMSRPDVKIIVGKCI
jgi:alpha-aminoadipic semialdehyde synthase